jgi:hypothetical protein
VAGLAVQLSAQQLGSISDAPAASAAAAV